MGAAVRALVAVALAVLVTAGWAGPRVSLEFWTISLQPFFTDFITGLVGSYESAHPDVDIRWVDVQIQAVEQKLLAAIAGGVAPDVVNLNVEFAARIAGRGALVDMDAAVPAQERARYFDGLWASTRVRGRSYGIPWYIAPPVLIYNVDLFRRAGLDPLDPPASEGAMVAAAIRIKDRTGVYGFMPLVDGTRLLHRFLENGLPVLSPDGRRAVFNSPATWPTCSSTCACSGTTTSPTTPCDADFWARWSATARASWGCWWWGPSFSSG